MWALLHVSDVVTMLYVQHDIFFFFGYILSKGRGIQLWMHYEIYNYAFGK